MNLLLDKINKDIITSKEKKLFRDCKAFLTKKAYKLANSGPHNRGRPFRKNANMNVVNDFEAANDVSVSDSSSFSSVSSSRTQGQRVFKKLRRHSPPKSHTSGPRSRSKKSGNSNPRGDPSSLVMGNVNSHVQMVPANGPTVSSVTQVHSKASFLVQTTIQDHLVRSQEKSQQRIVTYTLSTSPIILSPGMN